MVVHLAVPADDLAAHRLRIEQWGVGHLVHPRDELVEGVGLHEIDALVEEGAHRRRHAGPHPVDHLTHALCGQVGVLLRAREPELLADDLLRQHEPGVVVTGGHDVFERAQCVEAREQRHREPIAHRVQPHRRWPGQDSDAVVRPDRVVVVDALHVVPHPVGVDDARAGRLGDGQHPSVDEVRDARDHALGWVTHSLRPVRAHKVEVGADTARGDDHRLRVQFEVGHLNARTRRGPRHRGRFEDLAPHSVDDPARHRQVVDAVAEREAHQAAVGGRLDPRLERSEQTRAGPPCDVEARNRIAVAVGGVAAALCPADDREPAHPTLVQPGTLLAGREVDVRLGPLPRPDVLVVEAVEAGGSQPVLPRQLERVLDPHPPLLGRVDEEQPAEGPEGLAAEILLRLLVDQNHPAPRVGKFGGRDQARETGPDHDHIGIQRHWYLPWLRSSRTPGIGVVEPA